MRVAGLNHVAISTPDIERAIRFYRDVLGLEEAGRFELAPSPVVERATNLEGVAGVGALLRGSHLLLELFQFETPTPTPLDENRPVVDHGITHIALQVEDVDDAYRELSAAGMRFHCPPQAWPEGGRFTYGRDPDGNVIELIQPFGPDDPMWPAGGS